MNQEEMQMNAVKNEVISQLQAENERLVKIVAAMKAWAEGDLGKSLSDFMEILESQKGNDNEKEKD